MFTGIAQGIGMIRRIKPTRAGWQLAIELPRYLKRISRGGSLAMNGICVSVVEYKNRQCRADIMPETARRTAFPHWRVGDKINIERPLRSGDEIGGHFVTGHIDGIGKVMKMVRSQREVRATIKAPRPLMRYIAAQGSIAIDGISLTVVQVRGMSFTVALIPYTLTHTTLGGRQRGDVVNIEIDIIARYLEKLRNEK